MASSELTRRQALLGEKSQAAALPSAKDFALRTLSVLASLRLTVVLFSLAIFLIFVGTLAQKDHDVWQVVRETYFRVWVAHVELRTFERLAQMFFPSVNWGFTDTPYLLFPGGKPLGILLLANLLAAHAVRFKVAASGMRLYIGAAVIALGALFTWLVIQSGMDQAVVSERSPAFYAMLWNVMRASLAGLAFTGAYLLFVFGDRKSMTWRVALAIDIVAGALAAWLLWNSDFRLDNAGLRILWQLIQGLAAGGVLLAGCVLVFRKRAGIVLLHAGVALLMLAELWTAATDNEAQMSIPQGTAISYSADTRTAELAVINGAHEGHDHVTVVPRSLLRANVGADERLSHADLPFDVRVLRWLPNSNFRAPTTDDANPATAGAGLARVAELAPPMTGVGKDAGKVDLPAAYVELINKKTGESLGTYLVALGLENQPVEVDGQKYDVGLRFKRNYYPYSLALKEFRFDRYTGTSTAKNYSSRVQLNDPDCNVDREVLIKMNSPMRYAGTTFYQSSFDPETEQTTVLQVVANPGWMVPYVACMLVLTGMLAHFGVVLVRFLRRREDDAVALERTSTKAGMIPHGFNINGTSPTVWFPALIVLLFGFYLVGKARVPHSDPSGMQIYEFARLPLAYQGRIKPYDTLARNTLQILSGRQVVVGPVKSGWFAQTFGIEERTPAIFWLLDAIAGVDAADDYRVFRIENLDLLAALGLEPREGSFRYSLNEINSRPGELDRQIALLANIPEKDFSPFQTKVAELSTRRDLYRAMVYSFRSPPLSESKDEFVESVKQAQTLIARLRQVHAPCAVPPNAATTDWTTLMEAEFNVLRDRVLNQPPNPATVALSSLLHAYSKADTATYNKELANYRQVLAKYQQTLDANESQLQSAGVHNAEILSLPKVNFEVFYNQFSPFYYAAVMYVVAFILGVLSWIGWTGPLRRASVWLLLLTFALHTFALWARIYISGRPPVTNLYSATVFVGWAGVLLSLAFERIYRLGLGNIVAAVIGFLTLLVANFLSMDGDTFLVLQAVLDTQFWLATHVVCVTLGYAATFVAGLWGTMYILGAHVFNAYNEDTRRQLTRITYGTLCFAIFFSFVGTVLGGLWADDSWGRFWGWDPKENGALIIVLWNALVLHARWGGMVKGRGLAALAVGGNIAVAWSGFGVNEFGVGLHSYGASESSTAMWLLIFAISQLALIALGMMPTEWFARREAAAASS